MSVKPTDRPVERKAHAAGGENSGCWLHDIQCSTKRVQERQCPEMYQELHSATTLDKLEQEEKNAHVLILKNMEIYNSVTCDT